MPWTITKLPNFVNNTNEKELYDSATYFQSVIVGSRCSSRASEYTCAILEPACGPRWHILESCSDFLITGNRHNTAFVCQHFPQSTDPNVCVDISRSTSSSSSNNEPHDNVEASPELPKAEESLPTVLKENAEGREVFPEPEVKIEDSSSGNADESLPGESTPTEAPVFICDHSKFLCDDGSDCLSDESVCDGVQDCLDNSDELNCTQPECSIDDFSCATTKYCIPKTWVCDGADDCRDNSDEINCQENLNSDNDQEKLLAEASDLTPGLLSIANF
ncbi:Low-density lipoprotein receptor-related protein 2 [Armadillidium vulgare]|nr:Low-density lipoprotein receptor-related protein 2 [Armadillidium vulgare]